jgi:hypothetical protein
MVTSPAPSSSHRSSLSQIAVWVAGSSDAEGNAPTSKTCPDDGDSPTGDVATAGGVIDLADGDGSEGLTSPHAAMTSVATANAAILLLRHEGCLMRVQTPALRAV